MVSKINNYGALALLIVGVGLVSGPIQAETKEFNRPLEDQALQEIACQAIDQAGFAAELAGLEKPCQDQDFILRYKAFSDTQAGGLFKGTLTRQFVEGHFHSSFRCGVELTKTFASVTVDKAGNLQNQGEWVATAVYCDLD
jgi:hypothetical protein